MKAITKVAFWETMLSKIPLEVPIMAVEDAPIIEVIRKMQAQSSSCCLLVTNDSELVGICTVRDLMREYIGASMAENVPVSSVMSHNPITLHPEDTVSDAVKLFGRAHFRHLPIVKKDGHITGLLSVRLLMDFIAENLPEEVLNLPPDSTIIPRSREGG